MVKPPCINTTSYLEKQINNIFKELEKDHEMDDIQHRRIDQLKKLIKQSLKQNYEYEQENSHKTYLSEDDDTDHDVVVRRSSKRLKRKKIKH